MQLLFMSDVLTASGNKIGLEVLSRHPCKEAWLRMRWPNKQPTTSNMELWKNAMHLYAQANARTQESDNSLGKPTESGNGTGILTSQHSITQTAMVAQRMCSSRGESQITCITPTAKVMNTSTWCAWCSLHWRENIGGSFPQLKQ